MSSLPQLPPWSYEVCPGCRAAVGLEVHDLTCWQFDTRTRVVLAWICDPCDRVLDTVGLFTSWQEAFYARIRELDLRSARYFADNNPFTPTSDHAIPTYSRRTVPTHSRRPGPE